MGGLWSKRPCSVAGGGSASSESDDAPARGRDRGYHALVALVSTTDREGAAEALRRHYVNGRLTLDEFSDRMRIALKARRGWELRRALWGLPPVWRDPDEMRRI